MKVLFFLFFLHLDLIFWSVSPLWGESQAPLLRRHAHEVKKKKKNAAQTKWRAKPEIPASWNIGARAEVVRQVSSSGLTGMWRHEGRLRTNSAQMIYWSPRTLRRWFQVCVKPHWESDYHASGMLGLWHIGESFPLGSNFLPDLFCSVFSCCALLSSVAFLLDMMGNEFSNSILARWCWTLCTRPSLRFKLSSADSFNNSLSLYFQITY